MDKHTPGPWKTEINKAVHRPSVMCGKDERWEVTATVTGDSTANARLIAAAPELLAACKARLACDDDYDQGTKEWHDAVLTADEQMREAIKAAEQGK